VISINGYNAKIDVGGVETDINLATTPYLIDRTSMKQIRFTGTGVTSDCPTGILGDTLTINLDTVKFHVNMNDSENSSFVTSDNQLFQSVDTENYYMLPDTITVTGGDYVYNRTTDTTGSIVLTNINSDVYINVEAELIEEGILVATNSGELLKTTDGYRLALLEG